MGATLAVADGDRQLPGSVVQWAGVLVVSRHAQNLVQPIGSSSFTSKNLRFTYESGSAASVRLCE